MKPASRSGLVWLALLAAVNAPLLAGRLPEAFMLRPDRVADGEWWRLLTHPLAHVSVYHLLLDAGAFLLLWNQLPAGRRGCYTLLAAAGSLVFCALIPGALEYGLCGLSGVAHGLMAAVGLDLLREPATRRVGAVTLLTVVGKSVIEWGSGGDLFTGLHLGDVGRPVPAAHVGGILGAAAGWATCCVTSAVHHSGSGLPARAMSAES